MTVLMVLVPAPWRSGTFAVVRPCLCLGSGDLDRSQWAVLLLVPRRSWLPARCSSLPLPLLSDRDPDCATPVMLGLSLRLKLNLKLGLPGSSLRGSKVLPRRMQSTRVYLRVASPAVVHYVHCRRNPIRENDDGAFTIYCLLFFLFSPSLTSASASASGST